MSFGNEREFIDYLHGKEGKIMQCPLFRAAWLAGSREWKTEELFCLREECAWWDSVTGQCYIFTIATNLGCLANEVAEMVEKMPHELQFRKV